MKYYHANRLVTLAKYLATVPADRFDLGSFVEGADVGQNYIDLARLNSDHVQTCSANQLADVNCGTTACALGWAATIPSFKRAGLSLRVIVDEGYGDYNPTYYIGGDVYYNNVNGNETMNFMAGSEFFGITESESYFLFDPYKYRGNARDISNVLLHVEEVLHNYGYVEQANAVSDIYRTVSQNQ